MDPSPGLWGGGNSFLVGRDQGIISVPVLKYSQLTFLASLSVFVQFDSEFAQVRTTYSQSVSWPQMVPTLLHVSPEGSCEHL